MHCAPRPKERFPRVGAAREGRVGESSGTRPRLTHAQFEHLQHLRRGLARQRLQVDGFHGGAGPRRELAPQFQVALVPRQRVPEELERPYRVRGRVGAVAACVKINQ